LDQKNEIEAFKKSSESESRYFSPSSLPSFTSASYIRSPVPSSAKVFVPSQAPVSQPADSKRLRVALIGAPNAGKTSLLNAILKQPVGAVSKKVNTTRESILGVFTTENVQIEFIDCPGIVPYDGSEECKTLSAEAWKNFNDCDLALLIVDTVKKPTHEFLTLLRKICPKKSISEELNDFHNPSETKSSGRPVILVQNKADLVDDRRWLKVRNMQLSAHANFEKSFYVSAREGNNVLRLIEHLKSFAIPGPWQYHPDTITTLSMTEQLEQLVRAFLFTWFNKDVPYKIQQQTVGWTERLDGSLVIEHELLVKDSVVARMVLGTKVRLLQRLKENVVFKLKKLWGMESIVLLIHVKAENQRESKRDKLEKSKQQDFSTFFSRGGGQRS
jgi:GTP-binding protein Era